jgi:hypothetical protein
MASKPAPEGGGTAVAAPVAQPVPPPLAEGEGEAGAEAVFEGDAEGEGAAEEVAAGDALRGAEARGPAVAVCAITAADKPAAKAVRRVMGVCPADLLERGCFNLLSFPVAGVLSPGR